ncbi:MAG: M28 family metallopeptidase [Candidatus Helarchaeota archaeon]
MNFEKYSTALSEHITNLDYPRQSGSEGEKKAADYISSVFEKYGYEPKHESFKYLPQSSIKNVFEILMFTGYLILSLINLVYFENLIISLFVLAVPVLIILFFIRIDLLMKKVIKRNIKQFSKFEQIKNKNESSKKSFRECKNVFVEYTPPEYEKHIYITCHYDSTSLKLSMKTIIYFGLIGGLSFIGYFIIYLIEFISNLLNMEFFTNFWYLFLILSLLTAIFLNGLLIARGFRTNVSHGSIDDGTGVAIMLELSNVIREIKPRLKITFIAFSSEEYGFIGSSYHFYKNKNNFKSDLHVISIDMIGEIPPLTYVESINPIAKIKTDSSFNQKLSSIAKNNNIQLKGVNFLYPGSDFAVWLLNGYNANWLYTKSRFIHSKNDIASNVNKDLIEKCFILLVKFFQDYA